MNDLRYPDNPLTRLMEETAAANASGMQHPGVASANPLPTVRSASFGKIVEDNKPLSDEERAERDALAVAAGLQDPRLPGATTQDGAYATMEEALAAGAPVPAPVVHRAPVQSSRRTAREFTAQTSRLPDFRNIQGIDLLRNVVILDEMEFPITEEQAIEFKQFVVETARADIMNKFDAVTALFSLPLAAEEAHGGTEPLGSVQQLGEGSST